MYNICMSELRFAWDEKKNQRNKRIHGIAFEEAETHCYRDEDAVIRIISARKATTNETKTYNEFRG